MATNKPSKVLRFPRRRSYSQLIAQIEVQQLFIEMLCYVQPNPVHVLTQKQRRSLASVSRRTGIPQQRIMRRSVDNWMAIEAPVELSMMN